MTFDGFNRFYEPSFSEDWSLDVGRIGENCRASGNDRHLNVRILKCREQTGILSDLDLLIIYQLNFLFSC
jgi:hypothetical protein